MIDEIKLLVPLLQQAGEGTFWLVVLYFCISVLKLLMILGSVLGVVYVVCRTIIRTHDAANSQSNGRWEKAIVAVTDLWVHNANRPAGNALNKMREELVALKENT